MHWMYLSFLKLYRHSVTLFTAYLSTAVEPSVKTQYTSTLSTFAVLGSITGPSIGALFSRVDTTIIGLPLNSYNLPGFFIIVATLIMFVQVSVENCPCKGLYLVSPEVSNDAFPRPQTLLFFDGKDTKPDTIITHRDKEVNRSSTLDTEGSSFDSNDEEPLFNQEIEYTCKMTKKSDDGGILDTEEPSHDNSDDRKNSSNALHEEDSSSNSEELPFNAVGILMCIYFIVIFQYYFSVQETITTPMVIKLYDWSATEINLLFAGAGVVSIVTSLSVRYLSRRVQDQKLLIASIMIGLLGSILQMDIPPFEKILPVGRFIAGFVLTYIAYIIGRNVVMGIFSNVLGPSDQGKWMGVFTAAGAITRAIVPFLAWQAINVVHWRTWLEFGLRSLFLLSALVGSIVNIRFLVPYSEFVGGEFLVGR